MIFFLTRIMRRSLTPAFSFPSLSPILRTLMLPALIKLFQSWLSGCLRNRAGLVLAFTLLLVVGVRVPLRDLPLERDEREYSEEALPGAVLAQVRDYWGIEIRQHYRRDHTQREDHCQVRHPVAAQNLSLMRSLAIFLYERQRGDRGGKRSWPDWQRKHHRQPNALIARFTAGSG